MHREPPAEDHVYLADPKKKIQLLELDGEDVLAFESDVSYGSSAMDALAGAFAGGVTNVFFEGPGYVASTTHADPIVLEPLRPIQVQRSPEAEPLQGGGDQQEPV